MKILRCKAIVGCTSLNGDRTSFYKISDIDELNICITIINNLAEFESLKAELKLVLPLRLL